MFCDYFGLKGSCGYTNGDGTLGFPQVNRIARERGFFKEDISYHK